MNVPFGGSRLRRCHRRPRGGTRDDLSGAPDRGGADLDPGEHGDHPVEAQLAAVGEGVCASAGEEPSRGKRDDDQHRGAR
jgi:hypothetical protein